MMSCYQCGKVERGFNLWGKWGKIRRVWIRWRQGKCASNLDWRTAPGGGETMGMEVSCFPWGIFFDKILRTYFCRSRTYIVMFMYIYCWFLILSWISRIRMEFLKLKSCTFRIPIIQERNQTCWQTRGICKLMASGGHLKLCVLGLSRLWSYQAFCPLFLKTLKLQKSSPPKTPHHLTKVFQQNI